jgi:HrpA-like RNA helicase
VTLLADDWDSRVTPLGYAISAFPVAPRFGKMLALSHQQGMLPYTVCMVAALSVQEVLLETPIQKCQGEIENPKQARTQWSQTRRKWAGVGNSLLLGTCDYLLTFSLLESLSYMLIFIHTWNLGFITIFYPSMHACTHSHTLK